MEKGKRKARKGKTQKNRGHVIGAVVIGILLAAILLVLYYPEIKSQAAERADRGSNLFQAAPDFSAQNLDGSLFRLYDLNGTKTIVTFWATWCPPCVREMPLLQEALDSNPDELMVIGVNLGENPGVIKPFLQDHGITFPIVLDQNREIESQYNIILKPTTFFLNESMIIVDKRLGELREEDLQQRLERFLNQ